MATTISRYTSYNQYVHNGTINLNSTGKIKLALVTSEYVFSAAHTLFDNGADDSTDPSHCEVATGDGYTTGGAALASLSVKFHQLWLLYAGYGLVGGIGLGLGYIAPGSTLMRRRHHGGGAPVAVGTAGRTRCGDARHNL